MSYDLDNAKHLVNGFDEALVSALVVAGELPAAIREIERLRECLTHQSVCVEKLESRLRKAERERDEALADGVLSQRMCDVLNERDAYRAMVCDLVANNAKPVGDRAVWDRARDLAKHGPDGHANRHAGTEGK